MPSRLPSLDAGQEPRNGQEDGLCKIWRGALSLQVVEKSTHYHYIFFKKKIFPNLKYFLESSGLSLYECFISYSILEHSFAPRILTATSVTDYELLRPSGRFRIFSVLPASLSQLGIRATSTRDKDDLYPGQERRQPSIISNATKA